MRVGFLTNRTSQVNLAVLQRLATSNQVDLVHVYFYDTLTEGRGSLFQTLQQHGLRRIATKAIETIAGKARIGLGKLLGKPILRERLTYEYAVLHRLPHAVIDDLNRPEWLEHLRNLKLDILLVCVCKNILRQDAIETPRIATLNIHPSLLPSYRGPTPTFWMLYHEESVTGFTIHGMTSKIDVGPIVMQYSIPLDLTKSESEIETDVFRLAAEHLESALADAMVNKKCEPPSRMELGSYFSFPRPVDRIRLTEQQRARRRMR